MPLSLNPVLLRSWQKCIKKFDSILQSKSLLLASFFKEKIVSVAAAKRKPLKILQNLIKESSLLELPEIHKALATEKSEIFKLMANHIDQMRREFESRTGQSYDPIPGKQEMVKVKNFSPTLGAIAWSRQIHDKIKRISSYCEVLFKREEGFEPFKCEVGDLLKEIEGFEGEQLTKWKNEQEEASYSEEGLQLQMKGRMMELDLQNSTLTVNYSEKLITLIRDIRQLSELGLKKQIPKEILEIGENGKRYYKEALSLKKIASFYNNMGEEILSFQRGMVLRELQNFEECVESVNKSAENKEEITWDNPSSVRSYIRNLNEATNILVRENSRLYKLHHQVIEIIEDLGNYDLRKDRQVWLLKLEQIKALIEKACKNK
jgi:dynein heavy chain 2